VGGGLDGAGQLMPWRLKREVGLIILGALVMALSIVVLVLNRDAATEILGVIGLVGGLAIILNLLPADGKEHEP
jgi:hypothetical protein